MTADGRINHHVHAFLFAAFVSCLAVTVLAQTPAGDAVHYSATTTGAGLDSGTNVSIDIRRWSSDEDADKLLTAFKNNHDTWNEALEAAPSMGYVWMSTTSIGYRIKLARRVPASGGGSRVLLCVVPQLGTLARRPPNASEKDRPFTVIELRLNRAGAGDGKASLATSVVVDAEAKALVLEKYAAAPVTFKGVKPDA